LAYSIDGSRLCIACLPRFRSNVLLCNLFLGDGRNRNTLEDRLRLCTRSCTKYGVRSTWKKQGSWVTNLEPRFQTLSSVGGILRQGQALAWLAGGIVGTCTRTVAIDCCLFKLWLVRPTNSSSSALPPSYQSDGIGSRSGLAWAWVWVWAEVANRRLRVGSGYVRGCLPSEPGGGDSNPVSRPSEACTDHSSRTEDGVLVHLYGQGCWLILSLSPTAIPRAYP